jgi:uncharacterized protein
MVVDMSFDFIAAEGIAIYATRKKLAGAKRPPSMSLAYNRSVMIAKDLLEILVCPDDKQPLEYRQSPESLKCTKCKRVYAVKDDIPIMLVDEATIEP